MRHKKWFENKLSSQGVLAVYMRGVWRIFWVENLHPQYFGGSRDLSDTYFLGLKVCLIE